MPTSIDKAANSRTKRYGVKMRLLGAMSENVDCSTQKMWKCAATGKEEALMTDSRRAPHYPNAHKRPKLKPNRTSAKKQGSKIRFNFPPSAAANNGINNWLLKEGAVEPHQGAYNRRPPEHPLISPQCSKSTNPDHSCSSSCEGDFSKNFYGTCSPAFVYTETPEEHGVLMAEFS
jgi:hypothetical protein